MAFRLRFGIRSPLLPSRLFNSPLSYEARCEAKHRRGWKLYFGIKTMGGTLDVNVSQHADFFEADACIRLPVGPI